MCHPGLPHNPRRGNDAEMSLGQLAWLLASGNDADGARVVLSELASGVTGHRDFAVKTALLQHALEHASLSMVCQQLEAEGFGPRKPDA